MSDFLHCESENKSVFELDGWTNTPNALENPNKTIIFLLILLIGFITLGSFAYTQFITEFEINNLNKEEVEIIVDHLNKLKELVPDMFSDLNKQKIFKLFRVIVRDVKTLAKKEGYIEGTIEFNNFVRDYLQKEFSSFNILINNNFLINELNFSLD